MGLKQKIANALIHSNTSLDYELQHYSLGLKQKKIAKIKSKDRYARVNINSIRYSKWEQCKRAFVWFRLSLHYRIFRRKTYFFKDLRVQYEPNLPYMHGAESLGYKRWENFALTKYKLMTYDVISFDIFDTLILRPFQTPSDMFMVMGNRLQCVNYKTIRTNAENNARDKMQNQENHREITIYDIYREVSRDTGIDMDRGIKTELETEKDFCFANPYMKQVFNILKSQGKKIIITSDMYIPHDMMRELLSSCGYEGYDKLYVSCDYKCSKRDGGLYDEVLKDYEGKSIIHIGDNYESDILSAQYRGIDTYYYENCHHIGSKHRADGMSDLVGSLYAGIVNTHLHNGTHTYHPYYEYGFTYGGLYIVGFCNWIHKKAKEQGVDKILFLARDSDIYMKVFNKMYNDIPNEYVYWSRIANLKYTAEFNRYDFLTRVALHKAYATIPCSIGEVLDSIQLGSMKALLDNDVLHEEDTLTPDNLEDFRSFMIDNYDKVIKAYAKETKCAENKFRQIIGECKKVAVVDVGWLGSGPMGIKQLVERKWAMDCEVKCYMVGSTHPTTHINMDKLMDDTTETYIFSRMYNRSVYDTHSWTNKGTNNIYFELLTQACHPSFAGFGEDGEYKFDVPEIKNYAMTKEIQQGIIDFADQYLKFSSKDLFLRNISGYDAYMPYRFAIRDVNFVSNLLKEASFSRNVGVSAKTQKQETVGDISKVLNI